MNLCVNQLVEWQLQFGQTHIERLLWIDPDGTDLVTIELGNSRALPIRRFSSEIEVALTSNSARILGVDPYSNLLRPESDIPKNHRQYRDEAWAVIDPLVSDERIFIRSERSALVMSASARTGCTKKTIYNYLRRYWQGGQTKNALLPRYDQCGGKGVARIPTDKKRGRPSQLASLCHQPTGVNVDANMRELFRRGIRLFYENTSGRSLKAAYQLTLEKFFHRGYELHNEVWIPILPPAEELPTFRQFRYWYEKDRDLSKSLRLRNGQRRFNLEHRALLGSSTQMAFGPGSLYQIDATIGDIYLVSSLDRSRLIGRPVIYFVIDVFSRLITGFSVSLEGPSWLGAMLALENATADKVAFCAEYGSQINTADWPSCHLPEAILADRGELIGYNADNLVNALNIRVANTPPYRPDWKAIVERYFRLSNDKLIRWIPGAVNHCKQRGDKDYRLDALLDLHQFRKLMILCVVDYNKHHRLNSYQMDEFMIKDAVEPYPIDLWLWGIRNRVGHLRTLPPDVIRLNLLPAEEATVTPKGIRFQNLLYTCERALMEQWFVKARNSGSWRIKIAYDPRKLDTIYLRLNSSKQVEVCHLLQCSETWSGHDWHEAVDYWVGRQIAHSTAKSQELQAQAEFHATVEQIIADAKEQTDLSSSSSTKRNRLLGIRENRRNERDSEREKMAWQLGAEENPNTVLTEETGDFGYVPPPQPLDLLRKIREQAWNDEP